MPSPEISQITLPSGSSYFLKDEGARALIAALNNWEYTVSTDAASTPYGIQWDDDGTIITGTLVASADTTYKIYLVPTSDDTGNDGFKEYITITKDDGTTYQWEMLGTIVAPDLTNYMRKDEAGALAYKDTASGSGTVTVPKTFTTTTTVDTTDAKSVSVTGTTAGSVSLTKGKVEIKTKSSGTNSYTPEGSVSIKTAGGTTNVTGIDSVGTLPSATMPTYTVSNEVLTITGGSFNAGTLPTKATAVACKTSDPAYDFTGTTTYLETASDVGTAASFTGASMTATGTVNVPDTFTSTTTVDTTETKTVNVTVS